MKIIDPNFKKYSNEQKRFLYAFSIIWFGSLYLFISMKKISTTDAYIFLCIGALFIIVLKNNYNINLKKK